MNRTERQNLGIQKWINAGCRGTLEWTTGTGKTYAALTAIKSFLTTNKNKIITVIVPTENLKAQWLDKLTKYNLFQYVNVEIINSAIKRNDKINFIILDEVHKIPTNTAISIFKKRTPDLILGLSATFNRLDGRHIWLNDLCPVIDTISVKEAVENNWLSTYREYKVLIEPDDIEVFNEYSLKFTEAFSIFNFDFKLAMSCVTDIVERRKYAKMLGITQSEMTAITFLWKNMLHKRKAYIANHPKKLEIARKIIQNRPTSKIITFSSTIKQAELIGYGITVHSKKTKLQNKTLINDFISKSSGVINTAKSLDEGIDIPDLDVAIILFNTSSKTQKTQRIGRVIRYEENKVAEIFNLILKGTNEENWFQKSTVNQKFIEINEKELEDVLLYIPTYKIEQEGKDLDSLFIY